MTDLFLIRFIYESAAAMARGVSPWLQPYSVSADEEPKRSITGRLHRPRLWSVHRTRAGIDSEEKRVFLWCQWMCISILSVCWRARESPWLWSEAVAMWNWEPNAVSFNSLLDAGKAMLSWCWWPLWGRFLSSCYASFLYPGHHHPLCLAKLHCCPGRHLSHDKKQEETAQIRHTICLLPAFAMPLPSKRINTISKEFWRALYAQTRGIETQQWQAENGWKTAPHKCIHF